VTFNSQERVLVRNSVLLISVIAWILLLVDPGSMAMIARCPATGSGVMPASFQMLLGMNPPGSLAASWALMLVAMMSPVLIPPLSHIRLCSFAHRRPRSIVLFLAGYAAIWMAVGGVLLAIELTVNLFAPQSYLPAVGVVLIALMWQFSPTKQLCLNRCEAHTELAAFGAAADFDALRFGTMHGIWCASSCWALMLLPILLPRGHLVAMATVAVLIFSERLERPMPPCWRGRLRGKVIRIVFAQARISSACLRSRLAPFFFSS
jgi:predicted metal-binding membrane protein